MADDWEDKTVEMEYDGQQAGTVSCELKRQYTFGFAPRLKAVVRFMLDFTGKPPELPRPTRESSFTLSSGPALLGLRDGWRVRSLDTDDEPGRERLWLVLETK